MMGKMHRATLTIAIAALCLFGATALCVQAAAHVYTNRGEISAIDLTYDTVVVEVPMGDQMMTVGGPLVEGAELKKDNRSVSLGDFTVGETVTVKWRYTETGHRIEGLYAR
jgi:hypothetical protein